MSEEDIKTYIGIVTEEFTRRVNLAIEGLTGKMESMEDRLTKRIYSVEKRVGSLEKKVDSLDKRVDSLDTSVKQLKEELIAHRDNTEVHAQRAKRKSKAS